jgi:hypothetical protein
MGAFRRLAFLALACFLPAAAAAQTGTVTGTVTDSSTGLPIAGATIRIITLSISQVVSGSTNGSGVYTITNVPPGALYYVAATGPVGYVDELYPNVKKGRNALSTTLLPEAEPIAVAGGATVSGIDFTLDPDGRITGTITNASGGAPLSSISVFAYIRGGTSLNFFTSTSTNASGVYTFNGLPPDSYYLLTSNSLGFRNEIFDNIPCVGTCQTATALAMGTPVAVTSGSTASGRNFALDQGGILSGVVTNAVTSQPVQSVNVQAYTRVGTSVLFAGSTSTNAMGEYTIRGLASSTYYVYTSANNLTNEIYDNLLCPIFCSLTTAVGSGRGVDVTLGSTMGGINLALDPGGAISGTVTNEATGLPAPGVSAVAVVVVSGSIFTRSAVTNASGQYSITGLPTGSYALYTSTSGFANEIFDNIPCAGFCSSTPAFNTGNLVPVTAGATAANRNFALQPVSGGTIAGVITDADSGLPIAGVGVELWRVTGTSLTFENESLSDLAGQYTASDLPAGSYRVATFGFFGSHTFRNEVFDNIPCYSNFCSFDAIASGTPVDVTVGGTATADFKLSKGDGVLGTITDAATGLPLPGVSVQLLALSGDFAGSYSTNAAGQFFLRGVPDGTYVAYTSNSHGYRNEIFDNIPCTSSCSAATALRSGTAITVTGAAASTGGIQLVSGINFALDERTDAPGAPTSFRVVTSGSVARFSWSAPSLFNAPAPTSYLLEAGGSPGTTFITLPVPGTGTSFSVSNVPPGTFYVRIRAFNGTVQGPASNEVRLVVGAGGLGLPDAPTNLSAFVSGSLLTMTWNPPLGGGPPSGYIVEAGTASGASNVASLPVANPRFTYTPVPSGYFFLRVRSRNAAGVSVASPEVMIVAGGVPSPPPAPNFSSTSVSGSTVTLNWQAPPRSTPTSYIIEAGSAPGLANLAVVNTGTTALTASFGGVPPGTYYVRIRAVNAQGASVVSNERTITVS